MTQIQRIRSGLIDSTQTLHFEFNGKRFTGHPGDTLASALLANGQKLVGRSFKYHRPRGIFTAGSEEPNALVELRKGAFSEPNTRATVTELYEGLTCNSQNHRGPLERDFMAINDGLWRFLTAGFYYKTFMWPRSFWEKLYEPVIRHSAGLGSLSMQEDPDVYDKGFLHCELLIIGAGPAGLMAAVEAARSGVTVILADEDFRPGGRLNAETFAVNQQTGTEWAQSVFDELQSMTNVRVLLRTTVIGAYDHGIYGALERKTDHLLVSHGKPRQILWRIYSKKAILCAGATERPIAFANNDRPGIMLAAAVRSYINRWGVAPGKKVAVFTNNDDGWRTALDLLAADVEITAIVDSRKIDTPFPVAHVPVYMGEQITDTQGRLALRSVTLSNGERMPADCLAVSGGWNPNVHLTCHQGSKPIWREEIAAFVPNSTLPAGMAVAGAASGTLSLNNTLQEAQTLAKQSIQDLGKKPRGCALPVAENESTRTSPFWSVTHTSKHKRAWLDLQNDVTVKDVKLAHQEGFRSVEHLKRYTTLGMATDQGKTANIPALAIMAQCTGKSIAETGTTVFRPPYTPVSIGALAGRARGTHFRPRRLTPSHQWAKEQGAQFVEAGLWLRAQWFPQPGETHWRESVDREVLQTRQSVGVCDVTTLGKIDIQGRDAATFLNRVYCNAFAKLPVNKVRYGLLLREDGMAMDDGTTARLSETRFIMTTTTANAISVFRHLEFCRQCLWPALDVHLLSATEQYAQYAVAGPNSRRLLQKLVDKDYIISNEAFPFMACAEITICGGVPAKLYRISFSGELAYEIAVAARYGDALIRALMAAGEEFNVVPYGTEALGVMRIEKGHPAGNELNGQTSAQHLGMGRMASRKKDYIGHVLAQRKTFNADKAIRLIGVRPVDRTRSLTAGAHFVRQDRPHTTENDEGWLSSVAWSPTLGHAIGLGFLVDGANRVNEILTAVDPLRGTTQMVEIVSPHFVDPDGEKLRA